MLISKSFPSSCSPCQERAWAYLKMAPAILALVACITGIVLCAIHHYGPLAIFFGCSTAAGALAVYFLYQARTLKSLSEEVGLLKTENAGLKKTKEELEEVLAKSQEALALQKKLIDGLKHLNDSMKEGQKEFQEALIDFKKTQKSVEESSQSIQKEARTICEKTSELSETLSSILQTFQLFALKDEERFQAFLAIDRELKESTVALTKVKTELDGFKGERLRLSGDIDQLTKIKDELLKVVKDLKAQVDRLRPIQEKEIPS